SLSHLFCVVVRISPFIRWPNLVCHYMMPASGNENDLNMPSGTIEIFVRCYVEVERIMSAMDRTT
ncbi:hypothetical protein, partial [Escherichia coli]|uniref:hypothetical protein n=1 Tax=Escherichia coli TaxID=562 RepID=UPI001BC8A6B9